MPGIKEPSTSAHYQNHHSQASTSLSQSPISSPSQLETTSNILPSNGPSELFGELSSTYHDPHSSNTSVPRPSLTSAPLSDPYEGPDTSISLSSPPSLEGQSRSRKIQIRNRRLHYLTTHHSAYFDNTALELADPLLYDKCIRAFQTASEREAEGKRKGWSGVLHADLERAEARMEALRKATENRDSAQEAEDDEEYDKIKSKEEGIEIWEDAMTRRFLEGRDEDADYQMIDNNEEYDDVKQIERDVQEAYFDAETPGDAVEGQTCTDTGIQDF